MSYLEVITLTAFDLEGCLCGRCVKDAISKRPFPKNLIYPCVLTVETSAAQRRHFTKTLARTLMSQDKKAPTIQLWTGTQSPKRLVNFGHYSTKKKEKNSD